MGRRTGALADTGRGADASQSEAFFIAGVMVVCKVGWVQRLSKLILKHC